MALLQHCIRLIKLLARRSTEPVRCQTVVCRLYTGVEYDALSYTWGNPPADCPIDIDGRQTLVRKNLWRFLSQISTPGYDMPRLLWVDSISIDQENAEERSEQVGMMGQIYSQARKVIIWLGPAYHGSDQAMEALTDCLGLVSYKKKHAKFWSSARGLALSRLCNRLYWTRLWVLQEVMLANEITVICGGKQAEWSAFCKIMAAVDTETPRGIQGHRDISERNLDAFCMEMTAIGGAPAGHSKRNGDVQAILYSPGMAMVRHFRSQAVLEVGL